MKNKEKILFLILLVLAYFQFFYKLEVLPLRIWDEAKNAVSALEMMRNHDYLVRYYNGVPDDWGFKPPFLTWHQVFFMRLFGVSEFSVRLPSAIYALFTVILIFIFCLRELRSAEMGFIGGFILMTSYGYLEQHIARYGDHDSMLVFFLLLQSLTYYLYLNKEEGRTGNLTLFTLALTGAVFTKGVAGLFMVPGFFLYTLLTGKLKDVLGHSRFYLALIFFICFIASYYIYREVRNPGYLSGVWENELIPRYTNTADNYSYKSKNEYFFYLDSFWKKRFIPWIYLLPFAVTSLFFVRRKWEEKFFRYTLVLAISFLLIISFGTKFYWYDAPLYPLMALIISLSLIQWTRYFISLNGNKYLKWGIVSCLALVLIYYSLQVTGDRTFRIKERTWVYKEEGINYYLRARLKEGEQVQDLGIVYKGYFSHIVFYKDLLEETGSTLRFRNMEDLYPGDRVIVSQEEIKTFIEAHYRVSKEYLPYETVIYSIIGTPHQ